MPSAEKWNKVNTQILEHLNVEEEYRALGLDITGSRPTSGGWLACRAMGRDDKKPSAAIHVMDGSLRGRYVDRGGDGDSLSLWDFAAKYGPYSDWKEARKHFGKQAGVSKHFPKTEEDRQLDRLDLTARTPDAHFTLMTRKLVAKYPGITAESLFLCGAKIGRYPKKSREPRYVAALPTYGPHLLDGGPRGYVIMAVDGGMIQLYKGEDKKPEPLKRMTIGVSGLMGAHGLRNLENAELVFKVAGVSDMLALQALIPSGLREKYVVVTNAGGETETFLPQEVAGVFAGKKVVVVHDSDEPGQHGAKLWKSSLLAGGASDVVNCQLPFPVTEDHGKDLRDYIQNVTFQDLLDLVESTPADTLETLPQDEIVSPHQALLRKLDIMVRGELEGTSTIIAFSTTHCKQVEIKDIGRYPLARLIQHFGEGVEDHVYEGGEAPQGKVSMTAVRKAIAAEGGKKQIKFSDVLGAGAWEVNNRILLVGSRELLIYNGNLERSVVPDVDGKAIDFTSAGHWYDFDEVDRYIQQAKDPQWCKDVLNKLIELFAEWDNWKHKTDPELVAALACCTWLQTVWEWRPLVFVTGPAKCGKTVLIKETLGPFFGPLALAVDDLTEAGLRQQVRQTSKIIIIDEFENDRERQKILELARTSGRGGKVAKGTVNQQGILFGLRHILWCGAIETGLRKAADKSRFIILELKDVKKKAGEKLLKSKLPDDDELAELGMKAMVVALRYWNDVRTMARVLTNRGVEGVDHRIIESYSLPSAMLGCIMGLKPDEAGELMESIVEGRDVGAQQQSDEERLLSEIYESSVFVGHGERKSVSDLLSECVTDVGCVGGLRQSGIKKVDRKNNKGEAIFFAQDAIKRSLLKDSEFRFLESIRKCHSVFSGVATALR